MSCSLSLPALSDSPGDNLPSTKLWVHKEWPFQLICAPASSSWSRSLSYRKGLKKIKGSYKDKTNRFLHCFSSSLVTFVCQEWPPVRAPCSTERHLMAEEQHCERCNLETCHCTLKLGEKCEFPTWIPNLSSSCDLDHALIAPRSGEYLQNKTLLPQDVHRREALLLPSCLYFCIPEELSLQIGILMYFSYHKATCIGKSFSGG